VAFALATAKIKDFRLHDTRHTFASRLAMEGVDLLAIKELGGWKTLSMVQRYAHLSPGHQRQAIKRLVTRAASVPRPAEVDGGQQSAESVRGQSGQETGPLAVCPARSRADGR